jgi:hypothetical protein
MMRLIGNPNLMGPKLVAIAGMAFFSGTGPAGARCIDCIYVDAKSRRREKTGVLKGKCLKHCALMRGAAGPSFELHTPACKYFERAPSAAHAMASPHPRQDASSPWPARGGTKAPGTSGDSEMDMSKFGGDQYLKVEDLRINGPVQAVIETVEDGPFDKPVAILSDGSSVQLNITNTRTLIKAWGRDSAAWIGREVKLSVEQVDFRGEPTDSIVVRPVSAIPLGEQKRPGPDPIDDPDIPF